jgi:hypothetical protein
VRGEVWRVSLTTDLDDDPILGLFELFKCQQTFRVEGWKGGGEEMRGGGEEMEERRGEVVERRGGGEKSV